MFFYYEIVPPVPLVLTASVNTLTFPDTCIGASSLMTVSISAASLLGSEVEIVSVGDDSDQFDFSPATFALTGGVTNQLIDVTFTPTTWGQKSASLTLNATNGSVVVVHLEGLAAAVPLVLTSSANSITFANTMINTTSSQTFNVSAGGFSSVVETITLSDNSNQFDFSPSSFVLTGSGASQTVTAKFTPNVAGTPNGTLTLNSSGGSVKSVALSGLAYGPLVLTSSTNLMTFSNTAVNSLSSQNLTISAGGYATETVTLTDNTDQFDFSPTTFTLVGGGSQVVSVNYRPTTSSYKNGTITVASSGGSAKSVVVSGTATSYTRIAAGTVLAGQAAAGNKLPVSPPDGSEGWYFKNSTSSPASDKKFNYYFFATPPTQGAIAPSEIFSASMTSYFIASFPSASSANPNGCPFISIYTYPQGDGKDFIPGFYRSKKTYALTSSYGSLVTNTNYLFYTHTDPNAHQEIPANRRVKLTLSSVAAGGQQGPMGANEQISSITVGSNSTASLNAVEVTTRNAGVEFTDRLDEIVFLRVGSV